MILLADSEGLGQTAADAQSDQGLHCPLTELFEADLGLCCPHMPEGTFSRGAAHLITSNVLVYNKELVRLWLRMLIFVHDVGFRFSHNTQRHILHRTLIIFLSILALC